MKHPRLRPVREVQTVAPVREVRAVACAAPADPQAERGPGQTERVVNFRVRHDFDSSPTIFESCWMLCEWGNGVGDGSAVRRCHVDGVPDLGSLSSTSVFVGSPSLVERLFFPPLILPLTLWVVVEPLTNN